MLVFLLLVVALMLIMTSLHFTLVLGVMSLISMKGRIGATFRSTNYNKGVVSLLLFLLSSYGIYQATQYYLFSGPIFWYIIFSAGLLLSIYIAPLSTFLAPYLLKSKSKWGKAKNIYWNFVGASTWLWGILLILDKQTAIYLDEAGIGIRYGNIYLKMLGGVFLIIVGIYVTLMIISKNIDNRKFKSKKVTIINKLFFLEKKNIIKLLALFKDIRLTLILFLPVVSLLLLKVIYSIFVDRFVWFYSQETTYYLILMSLILLGMNILYTKDGLLSIKSKLFFISFLLIWLIIFWYLYSPLLILGILLFEIDIWLGVSSLITLLTQVISLVWLKNTYRKY